MKLVCNAALMAAVLAVVSLATSDVSAAAGAERAEPEAVTPEDPLAPVADWLMARDDPRQRAAGIEYRLSMMGMNASPTFDSASLLKALEDAIADAGDGPSLSWLAGACASGIQEFCMDAGLDDAIVRYDGGNFFSRMALREQPDVDEVRRLLVESSVQHSYVPELAAVWHDALQHHDVQVGDEAVSDLPLSLLTAMNAVTPSGGLIEACTSEIDVSSNWNDLCGRVGAEMATEGRTVAQRWRGWSLLEKRAEALGDSDRAAEYATELAAFRDRYACLSVSISARIDELDPAEQSEFIRWLVEDGELGAFERLAERNGLDCSDPPDARAGAMRRLRQLEAESAQP